MKTLLARLDANDELDETFVPDLSALKPAEWWRALALPLRSGGAVLREDSNRLLWLTPTGERNTAFPTNVHALFVVEAPNGDFYFGEETNQVGRLTAVGARLTSLNIPELLQFDYRVPLWINPDGSFFVNGSFGERNLERYEARRFHAEGTRDTHFPALPGRLVLVLKDGRLVVAGSSLPVPILIYHPDGSLDGSWPDTVLLGNAQSGPSVGSAQEVAGQLRFSGVEWVNGHSVSADYGGHVAFFLTNSPATSLQIAPSATGFYCPNWCWSEPENEPSVPFVFRFLRLGSTKAPATVHYTTRDITATAGKDYLAQSGTLTFAPFEVEKTVTIPILADNEKEYDETLELVVTGAEGIEAVPPPQRLTIRDPRGRGPVPTLDRVKRLRDGRVLLGGSASVGDRFPSIEFSHDLKTWHPLTNVLGGFTEEHAPSLWLDASATNAATRFYRAASH